MKFTFERPIIQGDVILKRLTELPAGVKLVKENANILQASEVTGHHHRFKPDSTVKLYQGNIESEVNTNTITLNEAKFIVVEEDSVLFHGKKFEYDPASTGTGDHKALTVGPGIYYVDIVREFDYSSMEEVRVID